MIHAPAAALLLALASLADEPLLPNGDFKEWKDGLPAGWTATIGATSPGDAVSELAPGAEGGVVLRGGAATGKWRSISSTLALEPGDCYRLTFEARASGVRREGKQFDNAHVGVRLPVTGTRMDFRVVPVEDRDWTADEIVFRAGDPGSATVTLFLSKTGALEVRGLALERLRPEDSYEILVRHMGRYYSHFASKGIDPVAWGTKHRESAAAAKNLPEWIAATTALLADLRDVHCTIRGQDGNTMQPFLPGVPRNIDAAVLPKVVSGLRNLGQTRGLGLAGTVGAGYGYLAIGRMPSNPAEFAPVLEAFDAVLNRPGIVLDLRGNTGGDEQRGIELASRLAKKDVVYGEVRVRSGPRPADLSAPRAKTLSARDGKRYDGPVVVLIGPGCVSSGEGLAQMMAAIDGVTLIGQPTAGASGNPQPVELPNGVTVHFSRWTVELPDGTPLEGRGVPPDVVVKHEGEGDPTLAEAIRILDAARKGEKR